MLKITIPGNEYWDSVKEEFSTVPGATLTLEHSLLAVSKWEAKWHRSFLNDGPKTEKEFLYYIQCMVIDEDFDPFVLRGITRKNLEDIREYLQDTQTATWFGKTDSYLNRDAQTPSKPKKNHEVITTELIYYWMVALQIPFECERWNLNRLMVLIRVCNEKNQPSKKMSKKQLMSRNTSLNQLRRQQLNSKG